MTTVVVPCPRITFCLGSLDKELVSMGLASLPACSSIMVKKGASSPSQQIPSYGLKSPSHQLRGATGPEISARVCHEDTKAGVLPWLSLEIKKNRANDQVLTATRQLG